ACAGPPERRTAPALAAAPAPACCAPADRSGPAGAGGPAARSGAAGRARASETAPRRPPPPAPRAGGPVAGAACRVAVRAAGIASCVAPPDQLWSVYVPNSPADTPEAVTVQAFDVPPGGRRAPRRLVERPTQASRP